MLRLCCNVRWCRHRSCRLSRSSSRSSRHNCTRLVLPLVLLLRDSLRSRVLCLCEDFARLDQSRFPLARYRRGRACCAAAPSFGRRICLRALRRGPLGLRWRRRRRRRHRRWIFHVWRNVEERCATFTLGDVALSNKILLCVRRHLRRRSRMHVVARDATPVTLCASTKQMRQIHAIMMSAAIHAHGLPSLSLSCIMYIRKRRVSMVHRIHPLFLVLLHVRAAMCVCACVCGWM